MVRLLKAARVVILAVLAGAFLAVGSQGIVPVTEAEAGATSGMTSAAPSDEVVARVDRVWPGDAR